MTDDVAVLIAEVEAFVKPVSNDHSKWCASCGDPWPDHHRSCGIGLLVRLLALVRETAQERDKWYQEGIRAIALGANEQLFREQAEAERDALRQALDRRIGPLMGG